jgi:putative transposase
VPCKECNLMDERRNFIARLLNGGRMAVLCREFGISRKSGYKPDRLRDAGLAALGPRR